MLICKYCSSERKNKNSLSNHQRLCSENPNRQKPNLIQRNGERPAFYDSIEYKEKQRHRTEAHLLAARSPEAREKARQLTLQRYRDPAAREKTSKAMRKAVLEHPDSYTKRNVVGRVKNIEYRGFILKGSWELLVAKTLDDLDISWGVPEVGFEYNFEGRPHLYFPDFLVDNTYIEVKGYERERDKAKWKAVERLVIIKEAEIRRIKKGEVDWLRQMLDKK